jgi:hypothetical protein
MVESTNILNVYFFLASSLISHLRRIKEMRVWVKIGDLATSAVVLTDNAIEPLTIFDLQEAIKTQREVKFRATDVDEIIVRPPTSTGVTERIDPIRLLSFGTDRWTADNPFVVDAPKGISTLNPFNISVSEILHA